MTTSSNVPAAARRQVEEANRLIAELNARPGDPPPADPAAPSADPASPAPPAAVAAAPPAPSLDEQLRQANARYASLQGKYNNEMAVMRAQLEQNNSLVGQLLEKASQPSPAPAAPEKPQTPEEFLKSLGATDEDLKDYGELLPIVVRLAQNMYKPTIEKLEGELNRLRSNNAATTARVVETSKQDIYAELDRKVPAWNAINESPHFVDWLKVHDIFAGTSRHVALSTAFKNLDKARVVGIFEAYAREHPEQARAPGAPPVDPATLLAPETRGDQPPAAPEGSGSKRIITEGEIRSFYARVRKKQVSKKDYDAFQSEIAKATAEGRVRPDRMPTEANAR